MGAPAEGVSGPQVKIDAAIVRARLQTGTCVIRTGEMVDVTGLTADEMAGCRFENGSGFVFTVEEGHPVKDKSQATAKPKKSKKKQVKVQKELPVDEVASDVPALSLSVPGGAQASVPLPGADVATPKAIVGAAPADLKAILPDAGNTSGLTVVLAGIAVLGGGAAWKFYSTFSKQKHEQTMARIEKGDHGACEAARAALDAKVNDVSRQLADALRRLDEVARLLEEQRRRVVALNNTDDLEERLEALEKPRKKVRRR